MAALHTRGDLTGGPVRLFFQSRSLIRVMPSSRLEHRLQAPGNIPQMAGVEELVPAGGESESSPKDNASSVSGKIIDGCT